MAIVHTELAGELPSFGRGLEGLVHNDVKVSQTFTLKTRRQKYRRHHSHRWCRVVVTTTILTLPALGRVGVGQTLGHGDIITVIVVNIIVIIITIITITIIFIAIIFLPALAGESLQRLGHVDDTAGQTA